MSGEGKNIQSTGVGAKVCRCPDKVYQHKRTNEVYAATQVGRPTDRRKTYAQIDRTREPAEIIQAGVCRFGVIFLASGADRDRHG